MKQVATNDLIRHELNRYNNPCLSPVAPTEMAPYLPRVDVMMIGNACAPAGRPVPRVTVRLAIYHGIALLDKTVHVYGDLNGREFVPFEQMPLDYERALGGPGHLENPYGTGVLPGSKLPNIMMPKDPGAVAGFGPIAQRLPRRAAKLGKLSPAVLTQPIPEFPDDFDWSYFQAAPQDQQLPSIMGNEWIVLEGINPEMTRISSRLPGVRAILTIFGTDPTDPDEAQSLQLRIDSLFIDADALQCSVIARGVVQIPDEQTLPKVRIAGAIETEEFSFAKLLVPPNKGSRSTAQMVVPGGTLRLEDYQSKVPEISLAESLDKPTLRQVNRKQPVASLNGTLGLDVIEESVTAPIHVPIIDVRQSLAATLDTYHVDLAAPSAQPPAPPEPEWLDESDIEEVYSVDPNSSPLSLRHFLADDQEEETT